MSPRGHLPLRGDAEGGTGDESDAGIFLTNTEHILQCSITGSYSDIINSPRPSFTLLRLIHEMPWLWDKMIETNQVATNGIIANFAQSVRNCLWKRTI